MAERKICAGYYRRHDGKVVYVVSLATDTDTGEESVIWTTYPFATVPRYYTSSKKSFCAFIEVNGERKAKYKRMLNMKISGEAIERLEEEGFRGPVRKRKNWQLDESYDSRDYQQSLTYYAYAKDLCEHYNFDRNKYRPVSYTHLEEYKAAPLRLGQLQRYLNAAEQLGALPLIYTCLLYTSRCGGRVNVTAGSNTA